VARLFEYQGKEILKNVGIKTPEGKVVKTPEEAVTAFQEIGGPVVIKIQVWATGRAGIGGVRFAETEDEVRRISEELLGKKVGEFEVKELLVEKKLDIKEEFFAGIVINDADKSPVVIFSSVGGTGIEEIAREHPDRVAKTTVDVVRGFYSYHGRELAKRAGIKGKLIVKIGSVLANLYKAMKLYDARSLEVNPLVLTEDGEIYAADCHMVVDDYAVYRHPELGIEIAREFSRPATELEKIAYKVEKDDYRGTFYFFQMVKDVPPDGKHIGFHGAGGGGSASRADPVHRPEKCAPRR